MHHRGQAINQYSIAAQGLCPALVRRLSEWSDVLERVKVALKRARLFFSGFLFSAFGLFSFHSDSG